MKIEVTSTDQGIPSIHLEAENDQDVQDLVCIKEQVEEARQVGIKSSKSGKGWNSCGSFTDADNKVQSLSMFLMLGVHGEDFPRVK